MKVKIRITVTVLQFIICVRVIGFNATSNNILAISWQSVSLVEEIKYSKKTTDLSPVTDKIYHINVVSSTPLHERDSNSQR